MRYLYILILLSSSVLQYAENQLDVVWQMQGEQSSDCFGYYVESLDFNGDNIDDLAVTAYQYYLNENYTNQRGKLYIYFGSDDGLGDSPDMTISTPVDTTFVYHDSWGFIKNLGDMNGDGCDDIGYRVEYSVNDSSRQTYHFCRILLGNTVNDTIPDYEYEVNNYLAEIHPLGDINGDGYDDAGITEGNHYLTYSIVYGGSFEKVTFVEGRYTRNGKGFRGLGDVNGDGYDDFSYYFQPDYIEQPDGSLLWCFFNRFFYGGTTQDTSPDYSLDYYSTLNLWYELNPAGDWNGDGYDDFVLSYYDATDDGSVSPGCRLWRGGETIHWDWYGHIEFYSYFNPSFGDINGDGKGDLVDTHIISTGDAGYLYFYIGDQNGTWDYNSYTFEPGYGTSSGHAVGDFDNDGYDDIAVGAYGDAGSSSPNNFGHVFVYGGHEDLVEQDLDPIDDETVPLADITFNAYPNPFNPEVSFEIKTDTEYHDLTIEIYNIRGQKVDSVPIPLIRGNKRGLSSTIPWKPKDKASGIYFCKLKMDGHVIQTKKVTLLK